MHARSDKGGLVGMQLVADRFKLAHEINPGLQLMGVALFAAGTGSKAIRKEVRRDVEKAFGGASPMFEATIRYSERTAATPATVGSSLTSWRSRPRSNRPGGNRCAMGPRAAAGCPRPWRRYRPITRR